MAALAAPPIVLRALQRFRQWLEERFGGRLREFVVFGSRARGDAKEDSDIDVLVVPSLWWENAPLTIHEAFLSKTPVVTSDIGGMKELVQHGVNGLHFKAGDAADLASVLRGLALDREALRKLEPDPAVVRDIREDAVSMLARYAAAMKSVSGEALA